KLYKKAKAKGMNKQEASPYIAENINVATILRKAAADWDGVSAMEGRMGHGDSFVLRDPAGIRPAYYYKDDEVIVVASERPAIQTVFNVPFEEVKELAPGNALIIKKDGSMKLSEIIAPLERR